MRKKSYLCNITSEGHPPSITGQKAMTITDMNKVNAAINELLDIIREGGQFDEKAGLTLKINHWWLTPETLRNIAEAARIIKDEYYITWQVDKDIIEKIEKQAKNDDY